MLRDTEIDNLCPSSRAFTLAGETGGQLSYKLFTFRYNNCYKNRALSVYISETRPDQVWESGKFSPRKRGGRMRLVKVLGGLKESEHDFLWG